MPKKKTNVLEWDKERLPWFYEPSVSKEPRDPFKPRKEPRKTEN